MKYTCLITVSHNLSLLLCAECYIHHSGIITVWSHNRLAPIGLSLWSMERERVGTHRGFHKTCPKFILLLGGANSRDLNWLGARALLNQAWAQKVGYRPDPRVAIQYRVLSTSGESWVEGPKFAHLFIPPPPSLHPSSIHPPSLHLSTHSQILAASLLCTSSCSGLGDSVQLWMRLPWLLGSWNSSLGEGTQVPDCRGQEVFRFYFLWTPGAWCPERGGHSKADPPCHLAILPAQNTLGESWYTS